MKVISLMLLNLSRLLIIILRAIILSKAFEAATLATQQHPNSVSIQLRKARVLLDKGRAVETLKILKNLENIEPGNHEIYIAKGTAMGMLGDIQGARKMFDYALTLDSDEVENILFAIVSVLQNLNYYEHLIPYLLRLIEKEPEFICSSLRSGLCL